MTKVDLDRMRRDRDVADEVEEKPTASIASFGEMKVEKRKLKDLIPAEYNPRKISKEAMAGLKASIEHFGLVQPIIVNETSGKIVGGHQRVQALIGMGVEEDDVLLVSYDDATERAANVALNSPSIAGTFTEGIEQVLLGINAELPDVFKTTRLEELMPKTASDFLDRYDEDKKADDDEEHDPKHSDRRDTVNFVVPLTPQQNEIVFEALNKAKGTDREAPGKRGPITSADALIVVCETFLGRNGDEE